MSVVIAASPQSGVLQTIVSRLSLKSDSCNNELLTGLGWQWQILVFLACFVIVVSHRPDAFFNPQFFGEDGTIWYPEAYMSGWFAALFHSRNGYFQTLPRHAAAISLIFPFRYAPLVENLIGITVQVLPINFLLSARVRNWGPLFVRMILAILYVGLPNTFQVDVAPEEGQWRLALLACLVVLACAPRTWSWRVFDTATILLSGLTGPFAIMLLPIALVFLYRDRTRWRMLVAAILAATAGIQLHALIALAAATRSHAPLGATPKLFLQILAGQIYLSGMLGQAAVQVARSVPELLAAAVFGTTIVGCCFLKARLEWKLFLAFCAAVFAASLLDPMVSDRVPQWQILKASHGIRYWFFPIAGFCWAMAWCATLANRMAIRYLGAAALLFTATGIAADWRYPAYTDFHFSESAQHFAAAGPGNMVYVPIFPPGWRMRLVKKNPACHGLLLGRVDRPRPDAEVSNSVEVTGWVAGEQPVQGLEIFLDRQLVQSFAPSFVRPDVDSFYPQSRDKYKGWGTTVDLSKFPPGRHELEIRASRPSGCTADIELVPIQLVR